MMIGSWLVGADIVSIACFAYSRRMTPSLTNIREELFALEERQAQESQETLAEFIPDGQEFVVRLNEPAAVHLCRQILDCVTKDFSGAHCHFDDHNFVDKGKGRLRIEKIC
ncbi:hypothetical protein QWY75_10300 [Pontixanthobacter aestiaquae]|uniref:Uncharacterized protein n=1 Tax=Pontixanthobacter aestiaquae TaxID=1509367 RepID=A0A844Z581_9SPHN|nr:hypothetical protein [Pontixanthobacter aestiaquae]MDN3646589.1 hypothetical protein [Pontixanthobacter aestiaquae]MXO82426.1 hypothetical protein [Pontixanthobacter aestiaquae]